MTNRNDRADPHIPVKSAEVSFLRRLLARCFGSEPRVHAVPDESEAARLAQFLLGQAPDAILVVDAEWRVLQASAAAQAVFGSAPSALRGRQVGELLPQFVERVHAEHDLRRGYGGVSLGWCWRGEARRASGECFSVDVESLWPLGDGRFPAALFVRDGYGSDLSQRSLASANRQLKEQRRELEEQLETRTKFFGALAHEIRGMLVPLVGGAEFARDVSLELSNADLTDTLGDMVTAGHRLWALVERTMQVSKIESGRMSVVVDSVDLVPLCRETVAQFAPTAAAAGTTIDWEPPEPEIIVLADEMRLAQVVRNLVDNAVKYTPGGTVTLRIERVGIPTRAGLGRVRLHVEDTGRGMAPEHVARVFEMFSQGSREHRQGAGGVGLGLCISRRLVEMMDGLISARSAMGKGSTFTVELNLAPAHMAPMPSIILDSSGPPVQRKVS